MTPQEMEKLLPPRCYVYLPEGKEIAIVVRGERGYTRSPQLSALGPYSAADGELTVKRLNHKEGISEIQASAMSAGLMLGWDNPAADPRNYDPLTGRLIKSRCHKRQKGKMPRNGKKLIERSQIGGNDEGNSNRKNSARG